MLLRPNLFLIPYGQFDDLDYPHGFVHQFFTLLERNMWMTFKDRQQFRARLILCTCVAMFQGLTYFQFSNRQETISVRTIAVISFFLFSFPVPLYLFPSLVSLLEETLISFSFFFFFSSLAYSYTCMFLTLSLLPPSRIDNPSSSQASSSMA